MSKIGYGLLGGILAVAALGFGEERAQPGSSAETYTALTNTASGAVGAAGQLAVRTVHVAGTVAEEGVVGLQGVVAPLAQPATTTNPGGLPAGTAPEAGQ